MTARKPKPEVPIGDIPLDDAPLPDDLALDALKESLGETDCMIHIYRQGPQGVRDLEVIDEIPLEQFNIMMLAYPPYDGGTFRLHGRSSGGIVMNRVVKVQRKIAPPVAQAAAGGLSRSEVVELFDDRMERLIARMQPAAPAVPPQSRKEMLEEMALLANLFKPAATVPAEKGPDMMGQLTMFAKLQEIIKGMAPAAPAGDSDLLTTLAPQLLQMIGNAQKAPQAAQPPALPALPLPAVETPPADEGPSVEDIEMNLAIKFAMSRACAAAARNDDPEEFAEKWYEEIPEEMLAQLRDDPHWFAKLCEVAPDCQAHEAWLSSLRDVFLRFMAEDAEELPLDNRPETMHAQTDLSTKSDSAVANDDIHAESSGENPAT